jgi:hypothetical protein
VDGKFLSRKWFIVKEETAYNIIIGSTNAVELMDRQ